MPDGIAYQNKDVLFKVLSKRQIGYRRIPYCRFYIWMKSFLNNKITTPKIRLFTDFPGLVIIQG
jgi:hypothetical protein